MRKALMMTAAILVAGTMIAAAEPGEQKSPPQAPDTGMPSDTGQKAGKMGKSGAVKSKDPANQKTNPPQAETGMPSDTEKKGKK